MTVVNADAPIGVIAHYNLLERLEPNGPGDLFRARDTRVGRTVAIRLLPSDFGKDAEDGASLVAAAGAVTMFSHPNAITVFGAGEHDGRVYIAFEFLKGQSLRAELAGRPMNVRRAVDLAAQLAAAVADVHAAGLTCAGLSPDSIVVTGKGLAKIPVWALASRDGFESLGGPARLRDYESPEEAQGAAADERSDAYSVGAVLFEMLTGRRPSPKGAAAPSGSNPNVPRELDEVALKAVAPNPERRFQSAAVLAAELRGLTAFEVRAEPAAAPQPRATGRPGRSWRVLTVSGLLLLLAAALWLFSGGLS